MTKTINFNSNHKKAKGVLKGIGNVFDKAAPYFIATALIADLAVGSFFLIDSYEQSLENGDFDPKDDKAIVMEVDGETVAIPVRSYKKNMKGDLVIVDYNGNRYTIPEDSNPILILGDDAVTRANEYVGEKLENTNNLGTMKL